VKTRQQVVWGFCCGDVKTGCREKRVGYKVHGRVAKKRRGQLGTLALKTKKRQIIINKKCVVRESSVGVNHRKIREGSWRGTTGSMIKDIPL